MIPTDAVERHTVSLLAAAPGVESRNILAGSFDRATSVAWCV